MTDLEPGQDDLVQDGGEAPVPDAAPAPVPAPAATPPQQPTVSSGVSARIAELEAELARLRAATIRGEKTLLLRVAGAHVQFVFAGHHIGTDPTPVPAAAVGAITEAATAAGVTLKEG